MPPGPTKTIIIMKNELLTGSELTEAVDDAERIDGSVAATGR